MPTSRDSIWFSQLEAARTGSLVALGQLFARLERYLHHVAAAQMHRDLRAKESASDLVQATFLEAMRDLGQFQGKTESEFRRWLKQMVINNIRDIGVKYRAKKRRLDREISLADCSDLPLIDDRDMPADVIARAEQAAALRDAMAALPDGLRQVVELRYEMNKSFFEIGEILRITDMAAQKRWHRALVYMRAIVAK